MLSRAYETSVMINSIKAIGEKKVLFYNLKNSSEPFRIQCTNPTLLLPYYQVLLNNDDSKADYKLVMVNDINDLKDIGYFLFAEKNSSINPWKLDCINEISTLKNILKNNNIKIEKFKDFNNYSLWIICEK